MIIKCKSELFRTTFIKLQNKLAEHKGEVNHTPFNLF